MTMTERTFTPLSHDLMAYTIWVAVPLSKNTPGLAEVMATEDEAVVVQLEVVVEEQHHL